MTVSSSPTRRALLIGTGAGAGLVVLAACSSGGSTPEGTESPAAPGSTDALVPPGTELAAVSAVPVGSALAVTVDDEPILVTQPVEGEIHAFSAICTHQGCPVGVGDGELLCPCHQSRYDLTTAAVLGGPAPRPLEEIPVTVEGDRVVAQ